VSVLGDELRELTSRYTPLLYAQMTDNKENPFDFEGEVIVDEFEGEVIVGGKFVKETYQIVQMYFALVKLDNACAVFTDGGLAFHHDRKSVVTEAGYTHVPLPACVHQYLSVNDNNAHGYAKAKWRKKVHDHSDDVNSSLALMHELNSIPKDVIEKWFNRNYLLHSNNMQVVHVEDLIVAPSKNNRRHHEIALHQFLQKYGRDYGYGDDIAEEILSELDGAYWAL
jgi:hypothetical protein